MKKKVKLNNLNINTLHSKLKLFTKKQLFDFKIIIYNNICYNLSGVSGQFAT